MFLFPLVSSSPHTNTQKVDQSNLAGVSASDLAIITSAAQISEDAETGAGGFDDAIAAAGGTGTTAGKALQNGKIKNKVLKLQTDVLRIQIEVSFTFFLDFERGGTDELIGSARKHR